MWEDYEETLLVYGKFICDEWVKRGFKDNMKDKFVKKINEYGFIFAKKPSWLGVVDFHKSHQSNLLRKNKEHYQRFFKNVPDNLDYMWPVQKRKV